MSEQRPVKVTFADGSAACRTVFPASTWLGLRERDRDLFWVELRVECIRQAAEQGIALEDSPGERVSQYIRFFRKDGDLFCDTGATEWTATDVWLQLTLKVDQ